MLHNLTGGFTQLGGSASILYLVGGSVLGMIIGVIPGLSTVVILSIILIFVNHIDLTGTLCLFLGAQCGSYYSASVSAILLNTPGHPEAFPITFDGYPMARDGQPGRALGLSACSTCVGGFIGCAILVAFIPIINTLPNLFHPPEFVAVVTLAMMLVGTLGSDSVAKAIISAGIGLMIASIGAASTDGTVRYAFGSPNVISGISLVAVAIGAFAIPQMVMIFGTGTTTARQDLTGKEMVDVEGVAITKGFNKELFGGVVETFRHWVVLIQSGVVGGLTGIIPGIGGFTGNFMAYGIAKQLSRKPELYGTGTPDGIIAPEGSSLAKEAGHMIPLLGLGIPGGVAGALFLGALAIKGLTVGYGFTTIHPTVSYEIVWIIALSGLIGTIAGLLVGKWIAKVTRVPGPILVPFIVAVCVIGPFLAETSFFAVMEMLVFALVGLVLRRLRYSLGSFAIGLVLGPTFEQNIFLTRNVYKGYSFITERPFADCIFAVAIVVLVLKGFEMRREKKKYAAAKEAALVGITDPAQLAEARQAQDLRDAPYPILAPLTTLGLIAYAVIFVAYGVSHYSQSNYVMPLVGGTLTAVPAFFLIPKDIRGYLRHRRFKLQLASTHNVNAREAGVLLRRLEAVRGVVAPLNAYETVDAVQSASAMGFSPTELQPSEPTVAPEPPKTGVKVIPPIEEKAWHRTGQYTREIYCYLWIFGLVGGCWVFGFIWSVPVFMFLYGMACVRRYIPTIQGRLFFSVLSAAVMWLFTYELFKLIHLTFTPVIHL